MCVWDEVCLPIRDREIGKSPGTKILIYQPAGGSKWLAELVHKHRAHFPLSLDITRWFQLEWLSAFFFTAGIWAQCPVINFCGRRASTCPQRYGKTAQSMRRNERFFGELAAGVFGCTFAVIGSSEQLEYR